MAKSQGISGPARAIHQQGGGLGLLMIEQPKPGTFGNTITLYATAGSDQNEDAKEFVNHAIQAQTKHAPEKNEVLRDASALEYGSKKFFRSDYKAALPYGHTAYRSFVFTHFRNYFIGEIVNTGSQAELDHAVDSLKGIPFREDTLQSIMRKVTATRRKPAAKNERRPDERRSILNEGAEGQSRGVRQLASRDSVRRASRSCRNH